MRELAPAWPPIPTASMRDGVEPFRRAVHRGCKAGRPRPHHDQVEDVPGHRVEGEAEVLGELARRRPAQHRDRRDDGGDVVGPQPHPGQDDVGIVDVLEVDPGVRQVRPGGEGAQLHRTRRIA